MRTPGPWEVVDGGMFEAKVLGPETNGARSILYQGPYEDGCLVAAAPELLEAANEVEAAIQGLALDAALKAATDKLYAAIRKAEGK